MEERNHDSLKKKDPLYKKLCEILEKTKDFWPEHKFDRRRFHIYCEASVCGADVINNSLDADAYNKLNNMKKEELVSYFLELRRTDLRTQQ